MSGIRCYVISTTGVLHRPRVPGSYLAVCSRNVRRGLPVLVADVDVDTRRCCSVCFPAMRGDLL